MILQLINTIWIIIILCITFTQGCLNQLTTALTRGPALQNIYIHKTVLKCDLLTRIMPIDSLTNFLCYYF